MWSLMLMKVNKNSVYIKPLNPELNPICYLLALLAYHFPHISRIMVKSLTLRLLISYIYIYIYEISSLRVKFLVGQFKHLRRNHAYDHRIMDSMSFQIYRC